MQQNQQLPKTIRIGTTGDYLPFTVHIDHTNEYHGFDIDMIRWMCDEMKITPEFVLTTWENLESDLSEGKFDFAIGGIELNKRRREKFLTSKEVISNKKAMLILSKDKDRFATLDDVDQEGVLVLVNKGGTNEEFACAKIKHATIMTTPENFSQVPKLISGECDVIITDHIEAIYYQGFFQECVTVLLDEEVSPTYSLGYLFARGNELLRDKINSYIDHILINHPVEISLAEYIDRLVKRLCEIKAQEKPRPIDFSELGKYEHLDVLNTIH